MKYREMLQRDHPDLVDGNCWGGCYGCPGDYYKGAPIVDEQCDADNEVCTRCWDTEAPGSVTIRCDLCNDLDKFGAIVCYLPLDNGDAEAVPLDYCPKCGRMVSLAANPTTTATAPKWNLDKVDIGIVKAYADANMNATEVSKRIYMHRNTVDYHLRKVKKITGLDPTNFHCLGKILAGIDIIDIDDAPVARPFAEWHEDHGSVLWWKFPVEEPPYVGSPLDADWPGYHTHWTPIICPKEEE